MASSVVIPTPAQKAVSNNKKSAVAGTKSPGLAITRYLIIIVLMLFYFIPLIATAMFGFSLPGVPFTMESLTTAVGTNQGMSSVVLTLVLSVLTVLCSLVLLVPTLLFLYLRSPKLLSIAEGISIIPFIIPPVALVSGANTFFRQVWPSFLVSSFSLIPFYVVLSLPLVYRSLDAGFRAIDVRTLWSASQSLGASALTTVFRVILPNLRTALLSASLLCLALCLGEYAVASLLLHRTFPVFTVTIGSSQPRGAAALSFITIIVTWGLLVLVSAASSFNSKKRSSS